MDKAMVFRRCTLPFTLGILFSSLAGCTGPALIGPPGGSGSEAGKGVERNFPPVSDSAEVYLRVSPSTSRYVLYPDGTFELQYLGTRWSSHSYSGEFARSDSTLVFDFDAWSRAGDWMADGILDQGGTRLWVEYNIVMILTDFESGLYVLVSVE